MKIKTLAFLISLLMSCSLIGQTDTLSLSLMQTIKIAQRDGIDLRFADVSFQNNYWQYQAFLAKLRPQLNLRGEIPNINRSIEPIILPDGTEAFINRSLMSNSARINLQQSIPLTGGQIFAQTGLRRIDLFSAVNNTNISYLSTPVSVGFVQPIFGFNSLKWEKRIAPLQYEESIKKYSEDFEKIAYDATGYFFEVLIAQLNLQAAYRDKANADTLYVISKGRYDVGKIAETEVMQMELQAMRANTTLSESILNLQTATERLRNFMGIQQEVAFKLVPPEDIPTFETDATEALELANRNRANALARQRRMLEAERTLAQARANTRPSFDLYASFGLSQTANNLEEVYRKPLDQEVFTLGFDIPIADWGKSNAAKQIAKANAELVRLQVEQDAVNFEREVLVRVQQFKLVKDQVNLAKRSYDLAQRRLDITQKRYLIGKIGPTDLNLAITEESSARRSYYSALSSYWLAHYYLRGLTLYDFENGVSLVKETK
ncbi:MAG: TolC family protein [Saprospiraceae bacterium]|nr:TolC family protein [Saprospiraceae bacterium]MCB9322314.1 TolC family protein [Lewinellaceae bacterium]